MTGSCFDSCNRDCSTLNAGFFRGLTVDQREYLLKRAHPEVLEPGETLYMAGDTEPHMYWIRAGLLKLSEDVEDGKPQTFGLFGQGRLLGIESIFRHPKRFDASAIVPSRCCRFDAKDFRKFVTTSPAFSFDLLEHLYSEMEESYRRISTLSHFSTEKRVLSLLCELACVKSDEGCLCSERTIEIPFNQTEMGEIIGASRVSVSKVISSLQEKDLITLSSGSVRIKQPHVLFSPLFPIIE